MDVDEDDVVLKEDEDADHRLAERWRFDGDDGPPHGPSGSDEQDRVLVDDYDSKYMNFLFDANDYGFLATDHTILRIATDGKKESYTPYRLGATPAMSISVNARPSIQGQGAIPVSQQVHQSVPISQQLKLPSGPSAVRPSVSGTPGAQGSSVPSAATTSSQSSPPRPSTVIPSPQVTHNGRPAMNMPSMDAIKLASNANVPVASFQQNSEQPDAGNTGFSQAEVARPKSQQQVHASPPQQIQPQTQGPVQAAASVNGLHPAYAALANANPTAYTLPQYIYPTNNSGLNNQQLQNLKSALSAANASGAQNYNAALFAQMQMPKTTNGVVVNGVTSATANPNMQNLGTSINLKPPPVRQMQRVPSGNNVNGAPSSSPPRPPSTVNGVPHNTANSPSPHMMHAMIPGDHVPVRAPSARLSASPMAAHAQMHQQPQMHNGHQVLQMFPQSSPPPMFASSQSYSLSPSPSKMQPASVPNGSPVMQPQQQQQQQVVGTSQGVY
jgi:enhancer of polycomb-like protein